MKELLDAAMDVFLDHQPDEAGRCTRADCRDKSDAGASQAREPVTEQPGVVGCRAYRSADAVLTLWSVRRHQITADSEVLRLPPGATAVTAWPVEVHRASGEVVHLPHGARLVYQTWPAGGHPSWCAGRPYCKIDHGLPHASRPQQAAGAVAVLMCVDDEPPLISIADESSHIVIRADTARTLSRVIRELSHRAVTPD